MSLGCCIFKRCQNVVFVELRVVLKDFLTRSPRAEQAQNIGDTDTQAANAWSPAAFAGFDGNSIKQTGPHDFSNNVCEFAGY